MTWRRVEETMKTREQIIIEAKRIRQKIAQIFLDADHWNHLHPSEQGINPDPDGMLLRLATAIDEMLAREMGIETRRIDAVGTTGCKATLEAKQ